MGESGQVRLLMVFDRCIFGFLPHSDCVNRTALISVYGTAQQQKQSSGVGCG